MDLSKLHGEELFSYLRENKNSLMQTKTEKLKLCDSVVSTVQLSPRETKEEANKADSLESSDPLPSKDTLDVTVVCNTAWVCDSHMDVLDEKAYDESISTKGSSIPHLVDHTHSCTAHVGDVTKVYKKSIALRELGLDQEGSTTALLMDSTVRKDYNEDVFKFYANGKINQHSIGLTYDSIELAINSKHEDYAKEFAVWEKYYPKIVNKDFVDKRGYFWYVPKIDVKENSCVLFGANSLTPTLSSKDDSIKDSSLGNVKDVITQPIGNTMTLEEAQGKIISLTQELATAKSDLSVARLEATKAEQARALNILKAQATFGEYAELQAAAVKCIEKGVDVDMSIANFEIITAGLQKASHVDTSKEGLKATILPDPSLDGNKIFKAAFNDALAQVPQDNFLARMK